MRRKKTKVAISIIIAIVMILLVISTSAEAASFSITSGRDSVTVGESYNITITATGLTGKFNISHSQNVSVNISSVFIDDGRADEKIIVTAKSVGKATVTISPDEETGISSSTTGELVKDENLLKPKTDTVTVKAKQNNNTTGGGSTGGNAGGNTTPTEPKFTSVNETVYATTEVNVRKSWSTSSGIIGSLGAGKSVTRIGKGDSGWSKVSFNGSTGYIYSEYLTTTQPKAEEQKPKEQPKNEEKSTNKNLAKLEVKPEGLTPEFKKDVTDYTIKVPNSIEKLDIIAEAEDSKSKVEISGNDKLVEGDNIVKILVTAEDGTTRTYIITATREKTVQSSLRLSALTIEGINIEPAFSPDIFAYTATLSNSEINELKVNATTSDENTTIEILGNSNLQDGENVITILLKSTKTDETTTYQITVNKPVQQAEKQGILPKLSAKEIFYIIAGIISLIILLLIIKRDKLNASKKNKEEKATNNGEYEQNKNEYLDQYETKEKIENNNFEETNEDSNDDLKKKKGKHF